MPGSRPRDRNFARRNVNGSRRYFNFNICLLKILQKREGLYRVLLRLLFRACCVKALEIFEFEFRVQEYIMNKRIQLASRFGRIRVVHGTVEVGTKKSKAVYRHLEFIPDDQEDASKPQVEYRGNGKVAAAIGGGIRWDIGTAAAEGPPPASGGSRHDLALSPWDAVVLDHKKEKDEKTSEKSQIPAAEAPRLVRGHASLVLVAESVAASALIVTRAAQRRKCVAVRLGMNGKVTGRSIAYIAVLLWLSLTMATIWIDEYYNVSLPQMYDFFVDYFEGPVEGMQAREHIDELLAWWNMQIFPAHASSAATNKTAAALRAALREQRATMEL
ncbi:hypothetical protein B0H14DRAFT_2609093 [Mycena olivaceomarginata]|nr:hypothetical protein B0H14DRAFT_2609093 [Mycena olivaceomarginata]